MTIPRSRAAITAILLLSALSSVSAAGFVWVTDMSSCSRASRFSTSGGAPDRTIDLEGGESCVIGTTAGEGRLWALGRFGCLVVSNNDPLTGDASSVFTLDGSECGSAIAYGGGSLWVPIGLRTVRINPSTGAVVGQVMPQGIYGVIGLAYGAGCLYYLDNSNCLRITKVDPLSGQVLQVLLLSGIYFVDAIAYGDGHIWVAGLMGSRRVSKVDPATGEVISTVTLDGIWPITSLSYEQMSSSPPALTVAGAKASPVGTSLTLKSVVVTAVFPDCAYVESADRAAGIKIVGSPLPPLDRVVDLEGVVEVGSGEKAIRVSALTEFGASVLRPMGISLGAVSSSPSGLSIGGLLVRTWGRVSEVGDGFFVLDDGSGQRIARVLVGDASVPALNDLVEAVGISTVYLRDGIWLPCLRLRGAPDLRVLGSSAKD